jgi:hypothetical protein
MASTSSWGNPAPGNPASLLISLPHGSEGITHGWIGLSRRSAISSGMF